VNNYRCRVLGLFAELWVVANFKGRCMGQIFLIDGRDVPLPANDAPVHQISDRICCWLIDELDQECVPRRAFLQINKPLYNVRRDLSLEQMIVHCIQGVAFAT
jgi:hypothetical protein